MVSGGEAGERDAAVWIDVLAASAAYGDGVAVRIRRAAGRARVDGQVAGRGGRGRAVDRVADRGCPAVGDGHGARRPATHRAIRCEPADLDRVTAGREPAVGDAAVDADAATAPTVHGHGVPVRIWSPTGRARVHGEVARRRGRGRAVDRV